MTSEKFHLLKTFQLHDTTEIWSSIFIYSVNLLMYPIFLLIFYLWINFLSNAFSKCEIFLFFSFFFVFSLVNSHVKTSTESATRISNFKNIIYITPIIYKSLMKHSCPKNWNWAVLVFGVPGSCNDSEKVNELLLSSFLLLQVFSI